jgi:type I restriction-modification system DNA methylase subunit
MGNAGRNGGEYYTPRPLIQAIVVMCGNALAGAWSNGLS